MLSCDTFALGKDYFTGHQTFLCKNSDRPLGEAQPLLFAAAADHAPGETLRCTHLTLPQAEHTYAVLGSKPYWIWGFEMGANEKGLFIGNEAQGSAARRKARKVCSVWICCVWRSSAPQPPARQLPCSEHSCRSTVRTPTPMCAMTAGMKTPTFSSTPKRSGSWKLQVGSGLQRKSPTGLPSPTVTPSQTTMTSAQRTWNALPVTGAIFPRVNRCTLQRRIPSRAPRQSHAVPRWRRMCALISAYKGPLSLQDAKQITRDHHDGEIIAPRFGACCANFISICMHAQDANSSQTAASMLFCHDDVLGMIFRYAPSIPCCSVFLPVYFTGTLPAALAAGDRYYDENSLWWNVERLSMAITADEERFGPDARAALLELEQSLEAKAADAEAQAKRLLAAGDKVASDHVLNDLTQYAVTELLTRSKSLSDQILRTISASGGLYGPRKEFLEEYCTWAHMTLA